MRSTSLAISARSSSPSKEVAADPHDADRTAVQKFNAAIAKSHGRCCKGFGGLHAVDSPRRIHLMMTPEDHAQLKTVKAYESPAAHRERERLKKKLKLDEREEAEAKGDEIIDADSESTAAASSTPSSAASSSRSRSRHSRNSSASSDSTAMIDIDSAAASSSFSSVEAAADDGMEEDDESEDDGEERKEPMKKPRPSRAATPEEKAGLQASLENGDCSELDEHGERIVYGKYKQPGLVSQQLSAS